jgi:hypothetical protein
MDVLSKAWSLPLGFIAGLLVTPFLMRWVLLVLGALGALPARLGTAEQRPRAASAWRALLHPVPALLVLGLGFGLPAIARSPARTEWFWFLAGLVAAPVLNGALVLRAYRTGRQWRPLDRLRKR